MPHQFLTLEDAAHKMGVSTTTLKSMAVQGEIECKERGGSFVFLQEVVDFWCSKHVIEDDKGKRKRRNRKVPAKLLSDLCPKECVCCNLPGTSRASIIDALTELADQSGFLYNPDDFRDAIAKREDLGTTNLGKGIAIPHTLVRGEGFFSDSFICLARLAQPSYFNSAPDGSITELLILSCCLDSDEHLNILMQISDICRLTHFMDDVRAAENDDELFEALVKAEVEVEKRIARNDVD